jgi:hypothetical protein
MLATRESASDRSRKEDEDVPNAQRRHVSMNGRNRPTFALLPDKMGPI